MQQYIIDEQVVAFLLQKPVDDESVGKFLDSYSNRLDEIFNKSAQNFLVKNDVDIEKVEEFIKVMEKSVNEDTDLSEEMQKYEDVLDQDEFRNQFSDHIENYNSKIYEKFTEKLTSEQKTELEKYNIERVKVIEDEAAKYREMILRALDEVEVEIKNKLGEGDETNMSDSNDLPDIDELAEPQQLTQTPEPELNETPEVIPQQEVASQDNTAQSQPTEEVATPSQPVQSEAGVSVVDQVPQVEPQATPAPAVPLAEEQSASPEISIEEQIGEPIAQPVVEQQPLETGNLNMIEEMPAQNEPESLEESNVEAIIRHRAQGAEVGGQVETQPAAEAVHEEPIESHPAISGVIQGDQGVDEISDNVPLSEIRGDVETEEVPQDVAQEVQQPEQQQAEQQPNVAPQPVQFNLTENAQPQVPQQPQNVQ